MFHFDGRRGYNSREATVQERRLLAPANSTTFSLSSKVLNSAMRKSLTACTYSSASINYCLAAACRNASQSSLRLLFESGYTKCLLAREATI